MYFHSKLYRMHELWNVKKYFLETSRIDIMRFGVYFFNNFQEEFRQSRINLIKEILILKILSTHYILKIFRF